MEYVTSYTKVAYVLWVRLMKALSSIKEASTAWVQPGPLPFFVNVSSWVSDYADFDISAQIAFDATVQKMGQSCEEGKPSIEYRSCSPSYTSLYFSASQSFNRYARRRGPPVVKPRTALIWPGLTIAHHVSHSVPAWSMTNRPLSQTLAKWVFNEAVQCSTGSPDTSVCAEDPHASSKIVAVVPWLGGDYNPFESCDTVGSGTLQTGEGSAHETISTECHPLICSEALDSLYYKLQPSGSARCLSKNTMQASTLNVAPTVPSNLCQQKNTKFTQLSSAADDECTWKQGMLLLGMKGSKVPGNDLYVDSALKSTVKEGAAGAGLFVRGGNPLYYTMKGTSEQVAQKLHSVLRGSLDDLAGQHIVLRVEMDANTLEPYMYVHRTPLSSSWWQQKNSSSAAQQQQQDPLESAYAASQLSTQQTGGNRGWLSNLESTMRSEQPLVDKLYPMDDAAGASSSSSSSSWSCPLLRIAFWSKVF